MKCACGCGQEPRLRTSRYVVGHGLKGKPSNNFKHGLTQSTEHIVWSGMKARCGNPNDPEYANYGGRGIRICDEWERDFMTFLRHVGRRPSPKHTIDRIDNDGHYEPGNCRWATIAEQSANRRNNRIITVSGESATIAEWSKRIGISTTGIAQRLRLGWPLERVVSAKVYRAKYPRAVFQCVQCGTSVETTQSSARDSKFCSNHCRLLSRNRLGLFQTKPG